ncbi:DUF55-domain-containing protein [Aspergillus affinis]|uniref:DUF55-domain-containing protein n=1 Tax=Aspergillus affinis TaxID=1070780 RepID=UPI0022FED906|nr:DUF55-domain-containing protein [Aspergillus affinis]KAI9042625.1 DUF55-domain-containing protein [Aspergillus affinis]
MAPNNRKRKSDGASLADEASSPKRQVAAPAPSTGEKRKRGRPRKYPEGTIPKPTSGRGRGRPRKDPNAGPYPPRSSSYPSGRSRTWTRTRSYASCHAHSNRRTETPSKPKTPQEGKRPVGRPRKSLPNTPLNGTDSPSQRKSASADAKVAEDDTDGSGRSYWLMKAEPESRMERGVDVKFSIDDLRERKKPEPWDGVRNPAARNHMRQMKKGDLAFFYHSNCRVPGIAGIMEIVQEHSPDESALDPAHPYYDEKSTREDPKWDVVHVEFRRKFQNYVPLDELKSNAKSGGKLESFQVLKQPRLSVSRVSKKEWDFVLDLAKEDPESEQSAESSEDASAEDEESSE